MNSRTYEDEFIVNEPINKVFEFFSNAENLEKVTPQFLEFKIISETPIDLKVGVTIDYKLKLRKIPLKWKTKITAWDPPHHFEDTQIKGPYKQWIHSHIFSSTPDGGTKIKDTVKYKVPGWIFEPLVHKFFVKRDIEKIFNFRREQFQNYFNSAS